MDKFNEISSFSSSAFEYSLYFISDMHIVGGIMFYNHTCLILLTTCLFCDISVTGHDSNEDAISCLQLMQLRLKEDARKEGRR